MFAPIKEVNFPLVLTPMVGLTHQPLRQLVQSYLPKGAYSLFFSEMLNSRRLPSEDFSMTPEVMRGANEIGWVPQILGNEEHFIAPSVEKLCDYGAVAIDINMGCPVRKALQHNYGVALMGDPLYAAEVVRITKRHSRVPVGVKLRAGKESSDPEYLLDFLLGLQEAGADWIALHPRAGSQQRRGRADWAQIGWVKERLRIPVVGNGDIQTKEDVLTMRQQTKCDLVMAGRALAARPWLLWQVGEALGFAPPDGKGGVAPRSPREEGREYGVALRTLLNGMVETWGERFASELILRKFRFHVRTTQVWLPFGQDLYSRVSKAKTVSEMHKELDEFFAFEIEMTGRTELRQ